MPSNDASSSRARAKAASALASGRPDEERVEQPDLVAPEAHVIVRGRAEGGEHPVAPEPLLGQDTIGAVAEQHGALAPPERGEQRGELRDGRAEVDRAVQLEPVDAGADLDLERPRLPVELAVGLDVPALLDELAHRARQVSRGQVECLARPVALVHGALAEARLPEARRGLPLGARVPSEEAAALRLEDARAVPIHADDGAVVVEAERRAQPLRAPVAGRRADPKAGPRRRGDLLVLELVGELEAGQARKPEERVEERAALRQRDAHRAVPAQVGEPRERRRRRRAAPRALPRRPGPPRGAAAPRTARPARRPGRAIR